MTTKTFLIHTTLTALLLSGCSQKAPDLQDASAGRNNVNDTTQIAADTVAINENTYGNENTIAASGMGADGVNANGTSSAGSNESRSDVLNSSNNVNSSASGFKSLYFGFGDYGIASSMDGRMATNANVARGGLGTIKIEGNCDEFGTDEYNYALGLKRAKSVKDNMQAQGVPANKMVIVSFGESNPVCSNPTDGCYAQNRRVDLRIVR